MLSDADYVKLDAIATAEGIHRKDFTSAEITACAIDRANQKNPKINAIVHENYQSALEQAALFDNSPTASSRSLVAGIPLLIKDLAEVKGLPTGFGSAMYRGYISTQDSSIVSRYIDAGLFVLGKTNTPEFGLTITTEPIANGPCRNPWNLEYSTGGSSGGAAAAVAAGIVPVAHASDGGGSIRIPAACCGLFGFKPSRGLTSVGHQQSESWGGMGVAHVLSRSVRDSAAFLDIIKLRSPQLYPLPDSPNSFYAELQKQRTESSDKKLRIAVQTSHPSGEVVDAACVLAVEQAAKLCLALGHQVEAAEYPVDHRLATAAMATHINVFSYRAVNKRALELGLQLDDCPLETSTRAMAERGAKLNASDFLTAGEMLTSVQHQMQKFHQKYDLIIQPVLAKTPAKLGWLNMNSSDLKSYAERFRAYSGFTAMANGCGQPSMSIPMAMSAQNLPIAAMFTAAWGNDLALLRLAAELEQAAPWPGLASNP